MHHYTNQNEDYGRQTIMANILIVEDESSLNEAYNLILSRQKHTVTSTYNGRDALEAIKKEVPDLVLLDLRMPEMDGIEFLENLQPAKNYPKLKIIVFSNYDVQKEIDKAFELGATRYMLKAWASPKELVRIVEDTLKGRKSTK